MTMCCPAETSGVHAPIGRLSLVDDSKNDAHTIISAAFFVHCVCVSQRACMWHVSYVQRKLKDGERHESRLFAADSAANLAPFERVRPLNWLSIDVTTLFFFFLVTMCAFFDLARAVASST